MIDLFKRDADGKVLPVWNVAERGDFAAPVTIHEWIEGAQVGVAPPNVLWQAEGAGPLTALNVADPAHGMLVKAMANWIDGMGQHLPTGDSEPLEYVPRGTYSLIGPGIRGNPYNLALPLIISWGVPFTPLMDRAPKLSDGAPDPSSEAWFAFLRQDVPRSPVKGVVLTSALGKLLGGVTRMEFGAGWPLVELVPTAAPAASESEAKP